MTKLICLALVTAMFVTGCFAQAAFAAEMDFGYVALGVVGVVLVAILTRGFVPNTLGTYRDGWIRSTYAYPIDPDKPTDPPFKVFISAKPSIFIHVEADASQPFAYAYNNEEYEVTEVMLKGNGEVWYRIRFNPDHLIEK